MTRLHTGGMVDGLRRTTHAERRRGHRADQAAELRLGTEAIAAGRQPVAAHAPAEVKAVVACSIDVPEAPDSDVAGAAPGLCHVPVTARRGARAPALHAGLAPEDRQRRGRGLRVGVRDPGALRGAERARGHAQVRDRRHGAPAAVMVKVWKAPLVVSVGFVAATR